ncbi:MAG TPA: PEP-CTERM sorting domain-containing protein [Myxococcota bacterium]|nr:PEP-CTERM sorting domain-containing protein [Myxococcota bacterium]
MRTLMIGSIVAVCMAVAIAPAQASPIAPGGTVAAAVVPNPTGSILADTGLISFSFGSPVSSGTIREIVYADTSNPFGSGFLSFVFQAHVATGDLTRVTGSSFAIVGTDVGINVPLAPFITSGTAQPATISRSAGAGDVIGFNFVPGLVPDASITDTSFEMIIRTNATAFHPGSIGVIDGGGQTLQGFAATVVPEPSTILLLGGGLAGLATKRSRRS